MSLLTLVSSQRLTVSQIGFINTLQASTINVSTLNWSNALTTTVLQSSLVSTTSGLQTSLVSTSLGLDTLTSVRLISTTGGLTGTIGSSASSFSTTLGNFQAGFPSTVSTSYGQSFTTNLLNTSTISLVNIQPSQNVWVAVGIDATSTNTIKYSLDGSNWLNSAGSGFSANGNGVAWNGTMWVAVGNDAVQNNTIKYSYNGINWFNSAGTGFTQGIGVAWNGRYWVAAGSGSFNASIKYSFNGINWSNVASGGFIDFGNSVAWNGMMWVATGATGSSLKYSYDGSNWFTGTNTFSSVGRGVAWNGRLWVAVGQDANSNNNIKYSLDGINWSNTGFGFSGNGNRVAWNGNLWVAAGFESSNGSLKYSVDGLTWFNSVSGGFQQGIASGIAWTGNFWVAMGGDNTSNARIKYSFDGINWLNSASGAFSSNGLGIAFSSNTLPSYNQNNLSILPQNIPIFITSTNTIFAQPSSLIINNTLEVDAILNRMGINCNVPQFTVDINGTLNASGQGILGSLGISTTQRNLWISGGANNGTGTFGLRTSLDGCNWTQVTNGVNSNFLANDIAYNGRLWVAVGNNSGLVASSIATSVDGLNWSLALGISSFQLGSNIRWNGQYWMASGSGQDLTGIFSGFAGHLQRSVDGSNWVPVINAFAGGGNGNGGGLGWGMDKWVAGGRSSGNASDCLKFSVDGNNWQNSLGATFVFDANFNRTCFGVAWNGNTWVAVGIGSVSILWSSNGIFWNNITGQGLTSGGAYGVAWGQDKWVVVGLDSNNTGNTMVYSFDGIFWQYTAGIRFPRQGWKVAYNGNYWLACGSNLNTASNIIISQNGINWLSTTNLGASVSQVFGLGYSSNQSILYNQPGFQILQSNIDVPLISTHTLSMTQSTLAIDNTIYVNRYTNNVGVNKIAQGYSLDINGSLNTSTLFINTSSLASIIQSLPGQPSYPSTVSSAYNVAFNTSSLITSSINLVNIPPNPLSFYVGGASDGVTAGNRLRWSVDGLNWNNIVTNTFTSNVTGVAWNGMMWVATGNDTTSNNRIKYSLDGINWSNSAGLTFSGGGRGLAWNGRYWIAVGSDSGNGTIKFSLNGINWSNCLSGGFTTFGFCVAWNGSYWVAGGGFESIAANNIKYSFDGSNWFPSASGAITTAPGGGTSAALSGVAWNGRMWVGTGFGVVNMKYSYDGSNWLDGSNGFSSSGNEVAWNGRIWVAVGSDSFSNNTIKYSSDGINWSNIPTNGFNFSGTSLVWNGTFWIAGGSSVAPQDRQKISTDGINWTSITNAIDFATIAFSSNLTPSYSQSNFSILPQNIPLFLNSTNTIQVQFSSILINNTLQIDSISNRVGINCNVPQVALDVAGAANTFQLRTSNMTIPQNTCNMWIAIGSDSTPGTRTGKFSFNGVNWSTTVSTIFNDTGYGVAFNGRLWVAVGCNTGVTQGTIKYSLDGFSWVNCLGSAFSSSGNSVAWNGRMWVAVGEDTTQNNTIKYSMDGITWSNSAGVGFPNGTFQAGNKVAWNGRMWIAVGCDFTSVNHSIKFSLDGINWSSIVSGGFVNSTGRGVAWNGRMWVALGTNSASNDSIKYSFNGLNWSNSPGSIFNQAGNGVAWNGYYWVAVGQDTVQNNRMKYSFDGINWSNSVSGAFDGFGWDVAWNGNQWVAVGNDTTANNRIKYSTDGLTWSNSTGAAITLTAYAIGFSSNVIPSFNQNSLIIGAQAQPLFLTSTNSIIPLQSSMILNDTVMIDGQWDRVGINCNVPRNTLDVAGQTFTSSIQTNIVSTIRLQASTIAVQNVPTLLLWADATKATVNNSTSIISTFSNVFLGSNYLQSNGSSNAAMILPYDGSYLFEIGGWICGSGSMLAGMIVTRGASLSTVYQRIRICPNPGCGISFVPFFWTLFQAGDRVQFYKNENNGSLSPFGLSPTMQVGIWNTTGGDDQQGPLKVWYYGGGSGNI